MPKHQRESCGSGLQFASELYYSVRTAMCENYRGRTRQITTAPFEKHLPFAQTLFCSSIDPLYRELNPAPPTISQQRRILNYWRRASAILQCSGAFTFSCNRCTRHTRRCLNWSRVTHPANSKFKHQRRIRASRSSNCQWKYRSNRQ